MSDEASTVNAKDLVASTVSHDGLASRVFIVASSSFLIAFIALTVALYTGKIEGQLYADKLSELVTSVGATYGLANVGQRLAGALGLKNL